MYFFKKKFIPSAYTYRGVTSKALSKDHTGSICSFHAGQRVVGVPGAKPKEGCCSRNLICMSMSRAYHTTCQSRSTQLMGGDNSNTD